MAEYDVPISGLRQRPSNTMPTLRNIRIAAGDDFTITATIYANEDAEPQAVNGTAYISFFSLEGYCGPAAWDMWSFSDWDYGSLGWGRYIPKTPILQVLGAFGSSPGAFVFAITPAMTQLWRGRYAFLVQLQNLGGGATIIRGIMDVEPGILFPNPALQPFILDQDALDGPDVLQ